MTDEIKLSNLDVRLARDESEVKAAQQLRYNVFYEEMNAKPSPQMAAEKRDFDQYDDVCEHLLVIDKSKTTSAAAVVGTYRMIRRSRLNPDIGFYSANEFNINVLQELPGEILEVGRSCIAPPYRNRAVMQLLWNGIATYIFQHDVQLLFGCASFRGNDPAELAMPLSYLYYHHLAPPALRPTAVPGRYVKMDTLPRAEVNLKAGLNLLPPLLKGYLRLGGFVGDGAVIDEQWGSIDVCVVVKTDLITDKYAKHYERVLQETDIL